MIRRVFEILGRQIAPLSISALVLVPTGALLSVCLVGLPIVVHAFGRISAAALRGAREVHGWADESRPPAGQSGLFVLAGLAVVGIAVLLAWGVVLRMGGGSPLQVLATLVAGALVGAPLAPLALAPIAAADGENGMLRPLVRSLELTAHVDPRRLAALGAGAGALTSAGFVLSGLWFTLAPRLLATPLFIVVVLAGCADAYVTLAAHDRQTRAAPLPRRVRSLALAVASLVLLGVCTTVVVTCIAALTPTPMRVLGHLPPARELHEPDFVLPGTSVHVQRLLDGVSIETPDGGGAGFVRAKLGDFHGRSASYIDDDAAAYGGPQGSIAVLATDGYNWAVTFVDRNGVRLDDSLTDRVLGRFGAVGMASLAIAAMLVFVLVAVFGTALGRARTLGAPRLDVAGGRGRQALEGTLRLGDGATVTPCGRRAVRVSGPAWLEAGEIRVRLPEGELAALCTAVEETPQDGDPLVLISRFRAPLAAGLRDSGAPWPEDGVLVLGALEKASEQLVQRATVVAAWLTLPVLAGFGVAVASVLLAL